MHKALYISKCVLSTYFYGLRFSGTSYLVSIHVRLTSFVSRTVLVIHITVFSKKIFLSSFVRIIKTCFNALVLSMSFSLHCTFYGFSNVLWMWKVKVGVHRGHHMRICQQLIWNTWSPLITRFVDSCLVHI